MDTTLIIIIAVVAVLAVLCGTFILIKCLKKKKNNHPTVNEEFMEQLIVALGGKKNISSAEVENGRVRVLLKDVEEARLEELKALTAAGVFITNQTIKMLFPYDSNLICSAILKRIKED